MRSRYLRIHSICYYTGSLLQILALVILTPLVVVAIYWGKDYGDGTQTILAFVLPAVLSWVAGALLRLWRAPTELDGTGSMLMCAVGWLCASAFGALPFVIGIQASYLDGYFEAMSGFTTTGITVFQGLDEMPRSILFWRSLTQWLGGLGIISFFLALIFRGKGSHKLLGAESHKISARRPAPGLLNTLKILWGVYGLFTVGSITLLALEGMPVFDAVNHTLTALSTGGFSPYDNSIGQYAFEDHANHRLIEYTLTFIMLLGGINFLVHYRVLTCDVKALWDSLEIRWWWGLLAAFVGIILLDHLSATGFLHQPQQDGQVAWHALEEGFRHTIFQVVSILTTTGFGTRDIGSFPVVSRQLFLVMMVIGGCVGSTGGGCKVMRIAVLTRLMRREVFRIRVPRRASSKLVIDGQLIPPNEINRVAVIFFSWILLLVLGGGITAALSGQGPWQSFSGMFSALGNIGPCYISVPDMVQIHWGVKLTYIVGMLAGRLEILPVLLLLAPKAWR